MAAYNYQKTIEVSGSISLMDRLKAGDNRLVPLQAIMVQVTGGADTSEPEGIVLVNIMCEGSAVATLRMPRESLLKFEQCLLSALMLEGGS
jgi:hypothetical protein